MCELTKISIKKANFTKKIKEVSIKILSVKRGLR